MRLSGLREDTEWLKMIGAAFGDPAMQAAAAYPLVIVPAGEAGDKILTLPDGVSKDTPYNDVDELKELPSRFSILRAGHDQAGYAQITTVPSEVQAMIDLVSTGDAPLPSSFSSRVTELVAGINVYQHFLGRSDAMLVGMGLIGYTEGRRLLRISSLIGLYIPENEGFLDRDTVRMMARDEEAIAGFHAYENGVTGVFDWWTSTIKLFVQWMSTHDMYPVTQKRVKPDNKKAKHTYKRRDLPRLIYMNRMPSAEEPHRGGGTHASPRGHERRGHYRTLRADCFKNHPKYMQENATYIKPVWIGPQETVHEGNRYTLITNEAEA